MASTYQTNWENYWTQLFDSGEPAFWDVPTNKELAALLPELKVAFGVDLPLVDFGCGNGTQTLLLAQHFSHVIGVDISSTAIAQARTRAQDGQPQFQVLDATSIDAAQALHTTLGDANVYMRGLLHQIQPADRPSIIHSLQTLMGTQGKLFLMELSSQAKQLFQKLTAQLGAPPPQLAQIFKQGIVPADITPEEIRTFFPEDQYKIKDMGNISYTSNTTLPDNTPLLVPCFCMLIMKIR
ncbi:class I SAM-dependent methyltransferase (plasmid) [Acaryochloris sp. 'Moss Beach']|uniref:class I SAM-dependent methyltransferase n=1 Tax=Acaryochloris sp. 'Moss Beach' TaxID=2740837 RepID=UPI001F1F726A|nr:class I SAM-dependent methyltransferase [Acaryochloris sp. 'Moss Beach']UJB72652.1 class I SAM-dependent methyltransferase [Acaryochloris sp. 'Moss Beach']